MFKKLNNYVKCYIFHRKCIKYFIIKTLNKIINT